ncbi:tetratricopeptide repeat protein [Actinokineospora auranticolor]|uniref:Tetratricopeptide repeat protein n=1 Tax=Actinokineospora auranticolor TaxID=155976 RepID=A0A2S6GN67_9PSEU|nr:tetratricopeptide repeat protein [Actinokineospora auranticolor]PPK66630.1 tetratricopeptide repeat protein [Actinokineospora auranticolor]
MGDTDRNTVAAPTAVAVQAGRVDGSVHVHTVYSAAREPSRVVPHQLPSHARGLVGRDAEFAWLDARLGDGRPGTAVVTGPGGVGKTALVVGWAATRLDEFPDGQLYVDLRGHGPDTPLDPHDVLGGFLRDLGVADREVPRSRHERVGRYRSVTHRRRLLVVLDNAVDEDQVRPLLPGPGAVVVTSRAVLSGLAVRHEAEILELDLLDARHGLELLRAAVGARAVREPAVAELVEYCGGLPLALRIVAELARSRPGAPLAGLAEELRHEQHRLDVLEVVGDARSSIRPVLSWSLDRVPVEVNRAFRLIGAHPTGEVDVPAVAALCAVPLSRAGRLLRALVGAHLIGEPRPGRFAAHDLSRLHAVELATADPDGTAAARVRLFDHVLHTADRADRLVTPNRYRVPLDGDATGAVGFADYDAALTWLHSHWRDAVALCALDGTGLDARRWQLAYTWRGYFFLTKRWDAWIASHRHALAACLRLDDRHAEARTRNNLGRALLETGRTEQATAHFEAAQRLFETVGDRHGWSNAVANQAVLRRRAGDLAEALRLNQLALDYYLAVGARRNTAITWRSRAKTRIEAGALDEAAADLDRAVEIFARLGLAIDLAEAHNLRGTIAARRGDPERAKQEHLAALDACRACGSRFEEAKALRYLGHLAANEGAMATAVAYLTSAASLHQDMGSPEAAVLAEEIRALVDHHT